MKEISFFVDDDVDWNTLAVGDTMYLARRRVEKRVLDHGFIALVDSMGTDGDVVDAARVSYGKGTKAVSRDRGLIRYLLKHKHTTPFEMVEFKFHVKCPIFVARQWIRHRTASVNEVSGRYSELSDEFFVPAPDDLAYQSTTNAQGRDGELPEDIAGDILSIIAESERRSYSDYQSLLDTGLSRELSRVVMPVAGYTEFYWKIDLHNLFHFLNLRQDSHAQKEIRAFADAMAEMVKRIVPICWEAYEDYIRGSVTLSRMEARVIAGLLGPVHGIRELLEREGCTSREIDDFFGHFPAEEPSP